MWWRISRCVHDAILAHAAADPAREVCGLLLGAEGDVTAHVATANVADDPARRFEVDPVALFAALRSARAGGPRLVGHYHSHPGGRAEPSMRDAADAAPDGRLWLIVAGDRIGAWVAVADGAVHGRFDRVVPEVVQVAAA